MSAARRLASIAPIPGTSGVRDADSVLTGAGTSAAILAIGSTG